ncbi:VOC family protein [Dawidia soli]|uniref:VOC family protein n=1 Tax=Dawidia soli TaxID=2782352 RepID=A0AAP2GF18_9BACT|nr:VOC family protein [Dawidia soli]MBT1688939.1 VOC family protein [Dawidia soli]
MKKLIILLGIVIGITSMLVAFTASAQTQPENVHPMKLNAGIITPKLKESREFYTRVLNFGVTFENEFYLLLHTPGRQAEVAFMLPDHASQQPLFQPAFGGKGIFLTIEVTDVDAEYKRIKALGIPIAIALRDEPWGDRHFAIVDPNGVGIDLVKYTQPAGQ